MAGQGADLTPFAPPAPYMPAGAPDYGAISRPVGLGALFQGLASGMNAGLDLAMKSRQLQNEADWRQMEMQHWDKMLGQKQPVNESVIARNEGIANRANAAATPKSYPAAGTPIPFADPNTGAQSIVLADGKGGFKPLPAQKQSLADILKQASKAQNVEPPTSSEPQTAAGLSWTNFLR